MAETHTLMPKKLAQVLMESGMQHLDLGGLVNGFENTFTPMGAGVAGMLRGQSPLGPIGGALGMGGTPGVSGFTAEAPGITTQNLQPYIGGQQQNQADVFSQQQSLANQLLAQTQGQGPGQQLIAAQAGKNAAQQSALMASQRGANANPALIARQAAMANANANQGALNAQSQLAMQSQGALAQQQSQMANQSLQGQSIGQGALAAQNSAITQGSLGAQNINANTQAQNASTRGGILGGVLGGVGGGLTSGLLAHGGQVKKMAVGGAVNDDIGIANFQTPGIGIPGLNPPQAYHQSQGMGMLGTALGKYLMGGAGLGGAAAGGDLGGGLGGAIGVGGAGEAAGAGIGGGWGAGLGIGAGEGIGAAVGAGEGVGQAAEIGADVGGAALARGGQVPFGQMLQGGRVPGKVAQPLTDNKKFDKVPTLLSPGEDVIPKSVAQLPEGKAKDQKVLEFMHHLKGGNKKRGYAAVAESRKAK